MELYQTIQPIVNKVNARIPVEKVSIATENGNTLILIQTIPTKHNPPTDKQIQQHPMNHQSQMNQ